MYLHFEMCEKSIRNDTKTIIGGQPLSYGGDNEVTECNILQCPKLELEDLVHTTKQTTIWGKVARLFRGEWIERRRREEEGFLSFVSLALGFVAAANAEERGMKSFVVLYRIPLLWPLSG